MPPEKKQSSGASSSNPAATKQWEGHFRHQAYLAEQEKQRRLRRGLSMLKPERKS
jgi:hypothetical protein